MVAEITSKKNKTGDPLSVLFTLRLKQVALWLVIPLCIAATTGQCEETPPEALDATAPLTPSTETLLQPIEPEQVRFALLAEKMDKESQVQWLSAGAQSFLTLYRSSLGASEQGAILIVADLGRHPDWPGPVRHLRKSLPNHGWATLSMASPHQVVQQGHTQGGPRPLPLTQADPKMTQRLQAAMTQIQGLGLYNIVVIAIGDAAPQTALALANLPPSSHVGFIALAPWSVSDSQQNDLAEAFTNVPASVLELTPALWPKLGLTKRKGMADKKRHPNYSQVRLLGDIRHFHDSPQLLPRIRGWLKRNAESMQGKLQQADDKR